jgi:transposase
MKRYDLTEAEYLSIKEFAEYKPKRGPAPTQVREMLNAIFWLLAAGAPWRCLPACFPPWQSVYTRFRAYQRRGLLDQMVKKLQRNLAGDSHLELTLVCVDGSSIRAHRHAAGARKKTTAKNKRQVARVAASAPSCTSFATAEAIHCSFA